MTDLQFRESVYLEVRSSRIGWLSQTRELSTSNSPGADFPPSQWFSLIFLIHFILFGRRFSLSRCTVEHFTQLLTGNTTLSSTLRFIPWKREISFSSDRADCSKISHCSLNSFRPEWIELHCLICVRQQLDDSSSFRLSTFLLFSESWINKPSAHWSARKHLLV